MATYNERLQANNSSLQDLLRDIKSLPDYVPPKPEQAKSVTYTTNGARAVRPDPGKVLSSVNVTVNVPSKKPVVQALTATENKVYNPPAGIDGFNPVTVNVSSGGSAVEYASVKESGYQDIISALATMKMDIFTCVVIGQTKYIGPGDGETDIILPLLISSVYVPESPMIADEILHDFTKVSITDGISVRSTDREGFSEVLRFTDTSEGCVVYGTDAGTGEWVEVCSPTVKGVGFDSDYWKIIVTDVGGAIRLPDLR